ncbi:hypothetical protein NX801_05075 [Streptomyces sp. LP05-1]|uniref:Uncharacterized protein n=1 Tax=Streptomyces pyxinae TaxID=2970734 RepID=A0ABT2CCC1_9ACTN|nr:hypothetical protein [Streptomyces sp. LP05-1]MCS0635039.1 hypothetical protein [Streptomyces sp. LP05-1]
MVGTDTTSTTYAMNTTYATGTPYATDTTDPTLSGPHHTAHGAGGTHRAAYGGTGRGAAASGETAGTRRLIVLTMPEPTVRALHEGGYTLSLCHAVGCDQGGGAPLVWATIREFAATTTLAWTAETYVCTTAASVPGAAHRRGSGSPGRTRLHPVRAGQIVAAGPDAVPVPCPHPGDPAAVTVLNSTRAPYSCGLAQTPPAGGDGLPAPYCAFPLHGGHLVFLTPLPRITLAFGTRPLRPGSPAGDIVGPTVLVDLARPGPAHLGFDLHRGWSSRDNRTTALGLGALTGALIEPTG